MSTMTAFGRVPTWGFGDRIRKIRRELGMSQSEFAAALSVGEKAVASWESGRTSPDDLVEVANAIQRHWQYSAAWLAGLDVPPQGPGNSSGITAGILPRNWSSVMRRTARPSRPAVLANAA